MQPVFGASGKSPLDVMIRNMTFWEKEAAAFAASFKALDRKENNRDQTNHTLELAHGLLSARENAQRCAVEAAPYVHPKLQSVITSPNPTAKKVTLTIPSQLNGEDRSYRAKGQLKSPNEVERFPALKGPLHRSEAHDHDQSARAPQRDTRWQLLLKHLLSFSKQVTGEITGSAMPIRSVGCFSFGTRLLI
jgi:hypothetical protein